MFERYAESKLANALFAKALSDRFAGSFSSFSVHPGFIVSHLYRDWLPSGLVPLLDVVARVIAKSPETGAHLSVIAALDPKLKNSSGVFLCSNGEIFDFPKVVNLESQSATALWEASVQAITSLKKK
jgi:NAD(P)-dependent dehydrogenase (short-subunit alcohol dehydrogenase family)